jgi:hypothetical protein
MTIVRRLKAMGQEFCELPPSCYLGVLLVSSLFAASPEEDVTAFVIDNTPLPACTRICWGGGWSCGGPDCRHFTCGRPIFAIPFVRHMYDWDDALEGGEDRDPFVSRDFHHVGHGSGVLVF